MQLIKISPEVYSLRGDVVSISDLDIDFLKTEVVNSRKGRIRINLHQSDDDLVHEMIIAIRKDSYIRPHLHVNKNESFHIIYGAVDVVLFDAFGHISQVISLEAYNRTKTFCYRMSKPTFHTLIVRSEILVMHEITNGPFISGDAVMADFAPENEDFEGVKKWTNYLKNAVVSEN